MSLNRNVKAPLEIRDSRLAERFVLDGWEVTSSRDSVLLWESLRWYHEATVADIALPPLAVFADLGQLVFGENRATATETPQPQTPLLPSDVRRIYEDHFLGKLYHDRSFDRGCDAIRGYREPRDQAKAFAYLWQQMAERAGYFGVVISPGVIRELQKQDGIGLTALAAERFAEHGRLRWAELNPGNVSVQDDALEVVPFFVQRLAECIREIGDVLGPEDIFELEHGTAVAPFGQRMALRQILEVATLLEEDIPDQPIKPARRSRQVVTKILEEDIYPIGGFSSISNRGSIESLLHSQLAYMERDERPDLFDLKFLRDELLYYSRDENQFLRRRRHFAFAFVPDLAAARFKDAELSWQRIILFEAALFVAVRRLLDWLSDDSLTFEWCLLQSSKTSAEDFFAEERELIEMLYRDEIINQNVTITEGESLTEFQQHCEDTARTSLCHGIVLSTRPHEFHLENALATRVCINGPTPRVAFDRDDWRTLPAETPMQLWRNLIVELLRYWSVE